MKVVFDTNTLIDDLNGIDAARDEIARCPDAAIGIITWMNLSVASEARNIHCLDRWRTPPR